MKKLFMNCLLLGWLTSTVFAMETESPDQQLQNAYLFNAINQRKSLKTVEELTKNLQLIAHYLDSGAEINAHKSPNLITPLHEAVVNKDIDLAYFLISNHADVNAIDIQKRTPLHLAAFFGLAQFVCLLLQNNANIEARDSDRKTALLVATEKGHDYIVEILIQDYKANINAEDNQKQTALHLAALTGRCDMVFTLLRNNATVDSLDVNGRTAFFLAIMNQKLGAAHILKINGHANPHRLDKDGHPAVFYTLK